MNGWIEIKGYLAGFFGSKNNVFFFGLAEVPVEPAAGETQFVVCTCQFADTEARAWPSAPALFTSEFV